ncbi:Cna B-type domain-containing protein [Adlercreutzia sp. ZJ242]|uniref:Cna B-type domain-containing protein n=1 Tax=Adlercreutzia sp. ZJ242 TaxID=2709409 RepID=UPI0013E9CEA3|nr:Cna B-type domain-containing protein [Adlercreutzia sp. ZJ242]
MKSKKTKRNVSSPANRALAVLLSFVLVFSQSTIGWAADAGDGAEASAKSSDAPAAVEKDARTTPAPTEADAGDGAEANAKGSETPAAAEEHASTTPAPTDAGEGAAGADGGKGENGGNNASISNGVIVLTDPQGNASRSQHSSEGNGISMRVTMNGESVRVKFDNQELMGSCDVSVMPGKEVVFQVIPADGYEIGPNSVQAFDASYNPIALIARNNGEYVIQGSDVKEGISLNVGAIASTNVPNEARDGDGTAVTFNVPASSITDRMFVLVKDNKSWKGAELTSNGKTLSGEMSTVTKLEEVVLVRLAYGKASEVDKKISGKDNSVWNWDEGNTKNFFVEVPAGKAFAGSYIVDSLDPANVFKDGVIAITATPITGKTTTRSYIYNQLGFAAEFGVFANRFVAKTDMEGNIAVNELDVEEWMNLNMGNSSNVDQNIKTIEVHITKYLQNNEGQSIVLDKPQTFKFGVFKKGSNEAIETVDITVPEGASYATGSVYIDVSGNGGGTDSSNYYNVYELDKDDDPLKSEPKNVSGNVVYDDKGKIVMNNPKNGDFTVSYVSNGFMGLTNEGIHASENVSYIGEKTGKGKVTTREGIHVVTIDENKDAVNAGFGGVFTNTGYNGDRRLDAVTPEEFKNFFENGKGISDMLTGTLATLSDDLAQLESDSAVQVYYLNAEDIKQNAVVDIPYSGDLKSTKAKPVIINLIIPAEGADQYTLDWDNMMRLYVGDYSMRPNNTFDVEGGNIIWNYVKYDDSGSLVPYAGMINANGSPSGTHLIPKGKIHYGKSTPGSVIADTVYQLDGEIHKVPFWPTNEPQVKVCDVAVANILEEGKTVQNGNDISLTVKKVWEDADNHDGIRPSSLTVTLKKDGKPYPNEEAAKVTLNVENGWSYTWENLPKDGTYTVEEVQWVGYFLSSTHTVSDSAGNTTITLTNKHVLTEASVEVEKRWNDNGSHPDAILVQLYADGAPCGAPLRIKEGLDGKWVGAWTDLLKYSDEGNHQRVNYTVGEVSAVVVEDGVEKTKTLDELGYSSVATSNVNGSYTSCVIENTRAPRATVQKIVNVLPETQLEKDSVDKLKKAKYRFDFYEENTGVEKPVFSVEVSDNEIAELPVDKLKDSVTYRVVENPASVQAAKDSLPEGASLEHMGKVSVNGKSNDDGSASFVYDQSKPWVTIVAENTFTAGKKKGSLEITKKVEGDGANLVSGKEFTFKVTKPDGTYAETQSVAAGKTVTFENLDAGTYTIEEVFEGSDAPAKPDSIEVEGAGAVLDGTGKYKATVEIAEDKVVTTSKVTFTNIYDARTSVSVEKKWQHANGIAMTSAPGGASVTVQLLANEEPMSKTNGEPMEDKTLNETNGWKDSWTDLPIKDESGKPIEYGVKETSVSGVDASFAAGVVSKSDDSSHAVTKYTVTNRENKRDLSILKNVVNNGDVTGIPELFTLILKQTKDEKGNALAEGAGYRQKIDLGDDQTRTLSNIPYGTYTLTESSASITGADWDFSLSASDGLGLKEVAIDGAKAYEFDYLPKNASGKQLTLTATNTYTKTQEAKGALTVKKVVTGDGATSAEKNATYTFALTPKNDGSSVSKSVAVSGSGEGQVVFNDLTPGDYTLTEVLPEGTTKKPVTSVVLKKGDADSAGDGLAAVSLPATITVKAGDTASASVVEVTNTYAKLTSVLVEKKWQDANGEGMPAPEGAKVTVQLLANGNAVSGKTLELSKEKGWSGSWTDLPTKDANGNLITYSVDESSVTVANAADYHKSVKVEETNGTYQVVITNKKNEHHALSIVKDVDADEGLKVPDSFPFTLQRIADESGNKLTDEAPYAFTLTDNKSWSKHDLPFGTYKLTEASASADNANWSFTLDDAVSCESAAAPDGAKAYTFEYTSANAANKTLSLKATNTYTKTQEAKGAFTLRKVVNDDATADEKNAEYHFTLTRDNAPEDTEPVEVSVKGNQSTVVEGLAPGTYTLTEVLSPEVRKPSSTTAKVVANNLTTAYNSMDGVKVTVAPGAAASVSLVEVTNTYAKLTSVSVEKAWKNADGSESEAPEGASVTMQLYQGNTRVEGKTLTLSEANDWEGAWTDLPAEDEDGNAIAYTVKEVKVSGVNASHYNPPEVTTTKSPDGEFHVLVINGATQRHLAIQKIVDNRSGVDAPTSFDFTLQRIADEQGNEVSDGAREFTLSSSGDSAQKSFTELPYGRYKLTESGEAKVAGADWTFSLSGVERQAVPGENAYTFEYTEKNAVGAVGKTLTITAENTYTNHAYGAFKLAKSVTGDGATDKDMQATYRFQLMPKDAPEGTEPISVKVQGNDAVMVERLEPGTYTLTEQLPNGKTPETSVVVTRNGEGTPAEYDSANGAEITIDANDTASTTVIEVTNAYERAEGSVTLSADKMLYAPDAAELNPAFSFVLSGATRDVEGEQFILREGEAEAVEMTAGDTLADDGTPFATCLSNAKFDDDEDGDGLRTAAIQFPTITYDKPGTYYYLLSEEAVQPTTLEDVSELQYDPMTWAIEVTVKEAADEATDEVSLEAEVTKVWQRYGGEDFWYDVALSEDGSGISFWNMSFMMLSACFAHNARVPVDSDDSAREVWVDPTVHKDLVGAELEEGQFSFTLYQLDAENPAGSAEMPVLTVRNDRYGNVSFNGKVVGSVDGGSRSFALRYDESQIGEHWYVIREDVSDRNARVIYDEDKAIYVYVNVYLEDGMLKAECTYYDAPSTSANKLVTEESLSFVNRAEGIDLQVRKQSKDESKDPLVGSTYGLWIANFDGGRDVYLGNAVSDEDGMITFRNVNLIEGECYYFKEEAAPEGHLVDSFRSAMFSPVWRDGKVALVYEDEESFVNRGLGGDGAGDPTQWKDNMVEE